VAVDDDEADVDHDDETVSDDAGSGSGGKDELNE